jgi:hypothetical protein
MGPHRVIIKTCQYVVCLATIALGCDGQDMYSSLAQAGVLAAALLPQQKPKAPADARLETFDLSQRWKHYAHRTYSAPRLSLLAAESAVDHALREPACWDRAGSSYAQRYMRAIDRRVIRNTAEFASGLLTGEDLRYVRSRSVRPSSRAWYAVRSAFQARTSNGAVRPAYTRYVSAAIAEASTAHWVGQTIQPRWMLQTLGWGALDQIQTNLLDEFGPDLRLVGIRMWKRLRHLPAAQTPSPTSNDSAAGFAVNE